MKGILYLLNGATSTGKTSTAKNLQELLPGPNTLLGIDTFHLSIPPSKCQLEDPDDRYFTPICYDENGKRFCKIEHGEYIDQIDAARFKSIVAFLNEGVHVIADEVFWRKKTVETFLNALKGQSVYMIGMFVDEDEGERRSTARFSASHPSDDLTSDFRPDGMSRASALFAHQFVHYDLEIDTTFFTPEQCAEKIAHFCQSNKPRALFELEKSFFNKKSC
jgi:chloramphenicol 3-O phosphotransferase